MGLDDRSLPQTLECYVYCWYSMRSMQNGHGVPDLREIERER